MPHWQTVVALLIVAGAVFLLVRRIRNRLKKGVPPACSCGCSECEVSNSCGEAVQDHHGPKQTFD
jgi:hypothetical protein